MATPYEILPFVTYSPYGERNVQASGAMASRDRIFDYLSQVFPQASATAQEASQMALAGARSPVFQQAQDLGTQFMRGDFLQDPLVARQADRAAAGVTGAAADATARSRAAAARAGQTFSSAQNQAAQSGQAKAAFDAESLRTDLLANYMQQARGQQLAGTQVAEQAVRSPIELASGASTAAFAPATAAAGVTTGLLAGGTQAMKPDYLQTPTYRDYRDRRALSFY